MFKVNTAGNKDKQYRSYLDKLNDWALETQ